MATINMPPVRSSNKHGLFNAWRIFIALWYLGGCAIHLRFALFQPGIYTRFALTPLSAVMARLWMSVVMPHISAFALLLAAFEATVGILLLSPGRAVKIGLTASLLFNLFLVQLGLGYPAVPYSWLDFVRNRLPNVLFILVQAPLFWVRFEKSIPSLFRNRFR